MQITPTLAKILNVIGIVFLVLTLIYAVDQGGLALQGKFPQSAPPIPEPITNPAVTTESPTATHLQAPPGSASPTESVGLNLTSTPTNDSGARAAILSTPLPDPLNAEQRARFDTANQNTSSQKSWRYSLTGLATFTSQGQQATINLTTTGFARGIGGPLADQGTADITIDAPGIIKGGGSSVTIHLDYRLIDGVMYFSGFSPQTGRKLDWECYNVNDMFSAVTGVPTVLLDPASNAVAPQLNIDNVQLDMIMPLVRSLNMRPFIVTTELPESGGMNIFRSQVLLRDYLASPDFARLVTLAMSSVGGATGVPNLGDMSQMVAGLPALLPQIVPKLDIVFERFIDKDQQLVTKIQLTIDGQLALGGLIQATNSTQVASDIDFNLNSTLSLSDFNTDFTFDKPASCTKQVLITPTP